MTNSFSSPTILLMHISKNLEFLPHPRSSHTAGGNYTMRSFNSFSGASLQRHMKKVSLSNSQMGSPAVCSLASTAIRPTIQKSLSGDSRI